MIMTFYPGLFRMVTYCFMLRIQIPSCYTHELFNTGILWPRPSVSVDNWIRTWVISVNIDISGNLFDADSWKSFYQHSGTSFLFWFLETILSLLTWSLTCCLSKSFNSLLQIDSWDFLWWLLHQVSLHPFIWIVLSCWSCFKC